MNKFRYKKRSQLQASELSFSTLGSVSFCFGQEVKVEGGGFQTQRQRRFRFIASRVSFTNSKQGEWHVPNPANEPFLQQLAGQSVLNVDFSRNLFLQTEWNPPWQNSR